MSTTTDFATAAHYSISAKPGTSRQSLIFRITTENTLQRGADLKWLSAFPSESEVLYPPLTYLQPTGRVQEIHIKELYSFIVVEVRPTIA
jgi:hypothetical protein